MSIELHNDDCLNIMRTLDDNSIDLIITDPPYGLNEWVGRKKGRSRLAIASEWGNQPWDNKIPDPEYFKEMQRISKNQIIFGGNYFAHLLPPSAAWLVWDKDNSGNFADVELAWTSFKTAARIFKYRWNGMLQGNMKNKEKRVHPTQKPTPLMEWVITNYSKKLELIFDPFMGSGTTGVSCMNLKRSFIGVEKEKQFFTIAKNRIQSAKQQLSF